MALNPYMNPSNLPYDGGLDWQPPSRGLGGSSPGTSFYDLKLIRGQFRNDLLKRKSVSNDSGEVVVPAIVTSDNCKLLSPVGSEEWPILNAFRPLARPSAGRGPATNLPFIVTGSELYWQMEIVSNVRAISAMTLFYELTIDIFDPLVLEIITDTKDQEAIQAYLDHPDTAPFPDIAWPKYAAATIEATPSSATSPTWTDWGLDSNKNPIQIALTGFKQGPTRTSPIKYTQKFNTPGSKGDLPADYTNQVQFRIRNRYQASSLTLKLYRVMLFNAVRTNIDSTQVPCSMLEYAFYVQFDFDSTLGTATWPDSLARPNFHVKIFAPDYQANSPGFAHSLSLRFLIFSMEIYGIGGVAYWVVFIGPTPGTKTILYTPSSNLDFRYPGNLIALNANPIYSGTASIVVQGIQTNDSTPPPDSADWANIVTYKIGDSFSIVSSNGFIQPFLYHHAAGNTKWWYRLVQVNQSGANTYTPAVRGMPYLGKSALNMYESSDLASATPLTVSRQPSTDLANVLTSDPIAMFYAVPSGDTYLASPISFTQGAWNVRLQARAVDPNNLLSTHLIARFWLVPETTPTSATQAQLEGYRSQTEFYFQPNTNPNGPAQLAFGTPTSLEQLLVSAPLSTDWELVEMSRYIETLAGSTSLSLNFSFGPNIRARLVVGLYAIAVPSLESNGTLPLQTDPLAPTFEIDLNANLCLVETSIQQTLSYSLNAVQSPRYNNSYYKTLPVPLNAVTQYAGGVNGSGSGIWTLYSGQTTFSTDGTPVTAFNGLFTLTGASTPGKFYIPYQTDIPLTKAQAETETNYKYVDFVSDVASLAGGRIESGAYQVTASVDIDADFNLLEVELRFELMLVQSDGTVVERIFRSGFLTRSGGNYTTPNSLNITIPFQIRSQDVQLILRTYVFPYSKTGSPVSIEDITNALAAHNPSSPKPTGLRFNSLSLTKHVVQQLVISETDSFPGSPAFYEQLPLEPNQTIGGQQFWYIASDDDLVAIISVPSINQFISITGTMYSPVWYCNLPEDIEVAVSAPSLGPTDLWIRTVPSTSSTKPIEIGISAVEDDASHTAHIVRSHVPDGSSSSTLEVSSTNYPHDSAYVKNDIEGTQGVLKTADYPSITKYTTTPGGKNDGIMVVYQREPSNVIEQNVAITYKQNERYAWGGPDIPFALTDFTASRRIARGVSHSTVATANNATTSFVAGWAAPGALIVKESWPYDCSQSASQAEGINYLVDGDPTTTLDFGQDVILPAGELNGTVSKTGSGLAVSSYGIVTCAYAIEGESGMIFIRRGRSGKGFGAAYVGVSLRTTGIDASSVLDCKGITLAHANDSATLIVAFWCGGKIFVAPTSTSFQGNVLERVQLVAGSSDFTTSSNPAHSTFLALQNQGLLLNAVLDSGELDVPQQRPGLVVSSTSNFADRAVVYYQDSTGKMCSRIVRIGNITEAKVLL